MSKWFGSSIAATVLVLSCSVVQAKAEQGAEGCERCQQVLDDIHSRLSERCEQVSSKEQLRQQPIYLFLSIFDEVSQGVPPSVRNQVYQAALVGMECRDPNTGVKAAQKEANRLMAESRT